MPAPVERPLDRKRRELSDDFLLPERTVAVIRRELNLKSVDFEREKEAFLEKMPQARYDPDSQLEPKFEQILGEFDHVFSFGEELSDENLDEELCLIVEGAEEGGPKSFAETLYFLGQIFRFNDDETFVANAQDLGVNPDDPSSVFQSEEIKHPAVQAMVIEFIGQMWERQSKPTLEIEEAHRLALTVRYFLIPHNRSFGASGLASSLNELGRGAKNRGAFFRAASLFEAGAELLEPLCDRSTLKMLENAALSRIEVEEYEKGLSLMEKAWKLQEEIELEEKEAALLRKNLLLTQLAAYRNRPQVSEDQWLDLARNMHQAWENCAELQLKIPNVELILALSEVHQKLNHQWLASCLENTARAISSSSGVTLENLQGDGHPAIRDLAREILRPSQE